MEKMKPRTLSGFMELEPTKQAQFEKIVQILRETYALYGFYPLDTPILEASEVLLAKGGGETEKQIYRFQKGDSDLAMRFDLTVPLAKYVASRYGSLSFPFRRFQIGKVYRGERAQRGRFREFYQADIDVIGDGSLDIVNEAEIPSIIYKIFTGLGLTRFRIRINNRKVLNGFLEMRGLTDRAADVMRAIDKMDKLGADAVRDALLEEGISRENTDAILSFISAGDDTDSVLQALEDYRGNNATLDEGILELGVIAQYLSDFGVPDSHFQIDLTIARGLDYYTGTVYETTMLDYPEIGSICSGGRYDNLAEYYTDKKLPGAGISIGLTRLFFVLQEKNLLNENPPASPADVLILPMTDNLGPAIALATRLRDEGIRTQLHCERKKFKSKISYAAKLSIPYVIFIGEDEIASNTVTLKDLSASKQVNTDFASAVEQIRGGLAERAKGKILKDC